MGVQEKTWTKTAPCFFSSCSASFLAFRSRLLQTSTVLIRDASILISAITFHTFRTLCFSFLNRNLFKICSLVKRLIWLYANCKENINKSSPAFIEPLVGRLDNPAFEQQAALLAEPVISAKQVLPHDWSFHKLFAVKGWARTAPTQKGYPAFLRRVSTRFIASLFFRKLRTARNGLPRDRKSVV